MLNHMPIRHRTHRRTTLQARPPPNVDAVRYQVVRLMRMLVQLCQSLEQVPDEVCVWGGEGE